MGKRDRKTPRPRVKKETIRKLDLPSLTDDDLAKVAGAKQPFTACCLTLC